MEIEGLHFLEYINLDPAGRTASEIARAWLRQMTRAIRHDPQHLITMGLPWFANVDREKLPITRP